MTAADKKQKAALQKVVRKAGGPRALGRALKVSHQAIYLWLNRGWVPPKRAVELEKLYGVHRRKLVNPQLAELLFT